MLTFIGRRLMVMLPTLILVSIFVFALQQLLPGDPAEVLAGEERDPQVIELIQQKYRLDQPLPVQYAYWLGNILTGDFGVSIRTQLPIAQTILQKLPITIQLALMAMGIAILIGIPAGIVAAVWRGTRLDHGANVVALSGLSIPNFWLGIMMILLFSVILGWLPVSGRSGLASFILPAITLGTSLAALLTRLMRSSLLEVLNQDYVRTATAKGLQRRLVLLKHAVRNALLSYVTVLGLQVATLMAGAVVTEQVFAWPGIGLLAIQAINSRDMPVIQGVVIVAALIVMSANLLVDILYALIDPRISYS